MCFGNEIQLGLESLVGMLIRVHDACEKINEARTAPLLKNNEARTAPLLKNNEATAPLLKNNEARTAPLLWHYMCFVLFGMPGSKHLGVEDHGGSAILVCYFMEPRLFWCAGS